jgi:hypothetical protein
MLVIDSSGQLYKSPAPELLPIGWAFIAQISAKIIQIKGPASR